MIRALLTATVVLGIAAGCSGSSANGDAGPGTGGSSAVHCRPLNSTSTDCDCSSAGSNSIAECSGDSVASTDHGYCCSGGGFFTCFRTACVSLPVIGYCECGSPLDDTSTRVDSCPQPAGGTCC